MSEVPTRLLRDALRVHAAQPPSSTCLDADSLARWADDAFDAKSRAALESHAASCARCQAMLAAMAKSAPALPARQPAWWRRPAFAWLVPAAACGAAAVVWLVVPDQQRAIAPPPDQTVTSLPSPAAAPPAVQVPSAQPGRPARSTQQVHARESVRQLPPPAVVSPEPRPSPQSMAPAAPLAAAPAPAAPRLEERVAPAAAAPAPPAAAATTDAIAGLGAGPTLAMKAVALSPRIDAPDGRTAWRLTPNGGVERTTDGGVTWTAQTTGVAVTLTAGTAPSATVCWLVGPAGTVVLSDDGQSWRRVPFPETIDLRSIRASDDKSATVSAVDGRTFATHDGGQTWTR